MKKTYIKWILISVIALILLPWCVYLISKKSIGEFVLIEYLFLINPIYFAHIGYISGKNHKKMWVYPLICTGIYLFSPCAIMMMKGNSVESIALACIYFVIANIGLFVSAWIESKRKYPALISLGCGTLSIIIHQVFLHWLPFPLLFYILLMVPILSFFGILISVKTRKNQSQNQILWIFGLFVSIVSLLLCTRNLLFILVVMLEIFEPIFILIIVLLIITKVLLNYLKP